MIRSTNITKSSKVRHLGSTINSQMHSVDVAVFDHEVDHVCELFGFARATHRRVPIEAVFSLL